MPGLAPPRDRFVTAGGLRLRYRDWGGSGRPLLALHGAAAHAHWWDPVAPYLRRRLRVLALDSRGHGRSAWPRPPAYRSEDFAAEILGVIEALGLEDVVVAGHSMGGHNALAFAAWHPERLARLVVVDARPHINVERLRALQRREPRPPTELPSLAQALARFRLRPPETLAPPALLRAIARHGVVRLPSGRWRYRFDPACERTRVPVDCWALLPRITAPTLVVRGEHSTILDRDVARRMVKTLPTAALEEIQGAHHHVTLDSPRALADCLLAWLG
ncbi:MAG TPA: alpha/beta hydrolase [Methylomirabilota bacterium]|jgi:pimeloyl-ACP methyl ester carboxylesterase|nr:alpha/beta hydrolase [Methylomirabilota bacterium]